MSGSASSPLTEVTNHLYPWNRTRTQSWCSVGVSCGVFLLHCEQQSTAQVCVNRTREHLIIITLSVWSLFFSLVAPVIDSPLDNGLENRFHSNDFWTVWALFWKTLGYTAPTPSRPAASLIRPFYKCSMFDLQTRVDVNIRVANFSNLPTSSRSAASPPSHFKGVNLPSSTFDWCFYSLT